MTELGLQGEGIYFRSKETPPGFFTLVLLRAKEGRDAESVRDLLARLWTLYTGLKVGEVPSLRPRTVPYEASDLRVVLGFGLDAFLLEGVAEAAPDDLKTHNFAEPRARGPIATDGPIQSRIRYASDVDPELSHAHFAVQFTANTPLAVERAAVETWKLLNEEGDDDALELAGVFSGSQRDDGRSWIDFHDGLSNLKSSEREAVIAIGANGVDPGDWTSQGTYLAFIRLRIHLEEWQRFDVSVQERLVGRDKLDGCPLSFQNGVGVKVDANCSDGRDFRNIQKVTNDAVASMSHIHRANNLPDEPVSNPNSNRIYRQGYQFFEGHPEAPHFRVGLNFVSFQNTPARLIVPLTTQSWFGEANFGGVDSLQETEEEPQVELLTAYAAGMFFVPPLATGERFPGARALNDAPVEAAA